MAYANWPTPSGCDLGMGGLLRGITFNPGPSSLKVGSVAVTGLGR
jgi:hypothetical protein